MDRRDLNKIAQQLRRRRTTATTAAELRDALQLAADMLETSATGATGAKTARPYVSVAAVRRRLADVQGQLKGARLTGAQGAVLASLEEQKQWLEGLLGEG